MIEVNLHKLLRFQAEESDLHFNTRIEMGSFTVLYGPSGSGKTSILRMFAGLLKPDSGRIIVNQNTWYDSSLKINWKTKDRNLGFVFQDYALFPNMTVIENLNYARKKGDGSGQTEQILELVQLKDLENSKPQVLSGGQQQRLALARALVQKTDILLLDEPLAAQDIEMREQLQTHLKKIHEEREVTVIMVSHDVSEIMELADKVIILEHGKPLREGRPHDVFTSKYDKMGFKLKGEVIELVQEGSLYWLKVLIGKDLIELKVNEEQGKSFKVGDQLEIGKRRSDLKIQET